MKDSGISFSLKVVGEGEEALSYLRSRDSDAGFDCPDIILLDPSGEGGLSALRAIKGDSDLKHVPVIALTTSNDEKDVENAYAAHANCYVAKPADSDHFSKTIRSIVTYWATVARL